MASLRKFDKFNQYLDYLIYIERCKIDQIFLESVNFPIHENFIGLKNKYKKAGLDFSEFNSIEELIFEFPNSGFHFLHQMYLVKMMEIFDIIPSSWNPNQPIDALKKLLNTQGPQAINANLRRVCYTNEPFVIAQEKNLAEPLGYEVYGWKVGTRKENIKISHCILVVGVTTSPKQYVYFVDPHDESNPTKLRPLYKVLYETFCKHAIYADSIRVSSGSPLNIENNNYTFTSNRFIRKY
ncbi:MAG: Conserved hypothetical rane protein [Francisellaceae bacterium]|nr:Conserved hypothetical rane protein [Francisellaceae bacterium]